MAEVAEILQFKKYAEKNKNDRFHYHDIIAQLKDAVRAGHDVQLHLHPSYFTAKYSNERWIMDFNTYNIAEYSYKNLCSMIKENKKFLENLLRPVKKGYECIAFRAGGWSMQPSRNIVKALTKNGIRIDTSVFKHGHRGGILNFNYDKAYSDLIPWPVDERDICIKDTSGSLFELPIYCKKKHIFRFLSFNRIYRVIQGKRHKLSQIKTDLDSNPVIGESQKSLKYKKFFMKAFRKYPWKMDYNQCTGRQLIQGLKMAMKEHDHINKELPFVLIGHSKLFTKMNERNIRVFLEYIANNKNASFATFNELDLNLYRD
jgi:hypothetical protein